MGVDPQTVDLEVHRPAPGIEHTDYQTSRQFTYLVRKIYNVRLMHDLKGDSKDPSIKEWVSAPKFISVTADLGKWLEELPRDLQVDFPEDGSLPFLSSHFIGNMHSYYHLTVIMLHRPQLMQPSAYADGSWRHHLAVCYDSSKKMCKLQEAILRNFGVSGLICMQRGINFVIYAVLTCTMVHLVRPLDGVNGRSTDHALGCGNISRSRVQQRFKGLLHAPHADTGNLHYGLATARDADTN